MLEGARSPDLDKGRDTDARPNLPQSTWFENAELAISLRCTPIKGIHFGPPQHHPTEKVVISRNGIPGVRPDEAEGGVTMAARLALSSDTSEGLDHGTRYPPPAQSGLLEGQSRQNTPQKQRDPPSG